MDERTVTIGLSPSQQAKAAELAATLKSAQESFDRFIEGCIFASDDPFVTSPFCRRVFNGDHVAITGTVVSEMKS